MLTPDEGYLDRRIAQEAASLAAIGWTVDIHATVDPALGFGGDLPAGVQLLRPPRSGTAPATRRRLLRRAKRLVVRLLPAIGDLVETAQYRRRTRELDLVETGFSDLSARSRYDVVFAHEDRKSTRLNSSH